MEGVTVVEKWDISLHNLGTRTGLRMNGSSININNKEKKNDRHMYRHKIQVNK